MRLAKLRIRSMALVGCVLGTLGGFWIGRAILMRTAKLNLTSYAQELSNHGDELTGEFRELFAEPAASGTAFCSADELANLRAKTFRSRSIKDIGRTHNGKLYCSAFLGQLETPYIEGPPTLVLMDQTHIYINVALLLASSSDGHGTVIEANDVNMVLSPDTFDHWDRPHIQYSVAIVDWPTGKMVPVAGAKLGIQPASVLKQGFNTANGIMYRSTCSTKSPTCVVTAERIGDIWTDSKGLLSIYALLGALAGFGLGLSVKLYQLQSRGLERQLRRDILKDSPSLKLVYEPILCVHTRRCVGAEALLRWTDADGNNVPPDRFIPIAESKGFITDLTAFVIRRSTMELGGLLRQHDGWTLNLNMAAADMQNELFFAALKEHVEEAGIRPWQIALELTERSTADLPITAAAIFRLRSIGYKVDIDDFGTGFSSLSYLGQLNIDSIKIDRAFTRTIGTDAVTASIIPQILAMAEALGLGAIVEGVETEKQCRYLENMNGALLMQGWYFGKSLDAAALSDFLICSNERAENPALTELIAR